MSNIVVSCIESRVEANGCLYGLFFIGPFSDGHGVTIGNGLRRWLLGQVGGIAFASAVIEGVEHEFCSMRGVAESVLDILFNLQGVVLSGELLPSSTPFAFVQAQGPGLVCAGEIRLPAGLRVVNPARKIATLSSDGALRMRLAFGEARKDDPLATPFGTPPPTRQESQTLSHYQLSSPLYPPLSPQRGGAPEWSKGDKRGVEGGGRGGVGAGEGPGKGRLTHSNRVKGGKTPPSRGVRGGDNQRNPAQGRPEIGQAEVGESWWRWTPLPVEMLRVPVVRVNYQLENDDRHEDARARERLLFEIWTNGSIHPRRALLEALKEWTALLIKLQRAEGAISPKRRHLPPSFHAASPSESLLQERGTYPSWRMGDTSLRGSRSRRGMPMPLTGQSVSGGGKELPLRGKVWGEGRPQTQTGGNGDLGDTPLRGSVGGGYPQQVGNGEALPSPSPDICNLELSVKTYSALKRAGINRISELFSFSRGQLLALDMIDVSSLREIEANGWTFGLQLSERGSPLPLMLRVGGGRREADGEGEGLEEEGGGSPPFKSVQPF